jgi:hypothetical protein
MLGCRQTHEQMSDALDGALPWWKRMLMRFHLGLCPVCKRTDKSLREAVDATHALRDVPPSPEDM